MDKNVRTAILREDALNGVINYDSYYYYFFKSYVSDGNESSQIRYANAAYSAFSKMNISIDRCELIVGKSVPYGFTQEESAEWELLRKYAVAGGDHSYGQADHMAIDYELLLSKGINGIKEDINAKLSKLDPLIGDDLRKENFYLSCLKTLDGVIVLANRYSDFARSLAAETDDCERKSELLKISDICRHVPEFPPRSFHEAVQSVHFISYVLSCKAPRVGCMAQYQLGRPDRYLYRFYKTDKENGLITDDEAQMLLNCLGILINRRVPRGLSCGYMIGGRDKDGNVVSNELTHMLMNVIAENRLVYPSVGFCCCADTPEDDIDSACRILATGASHPAFFNDDVISAGLRYYGLSPEEACSYIHSTCVEITPIASSSVWVASPYHNLMQKLIDILDHEYASADELMEAYLSHLADAIRAEFLAQNRTRLTRERTFDPLLSCFVNDCLELGLDIEHGGARYNWIMPSFVGLSNTADSFAAIDEFIFKQHKFDFKTLSFMLKTNFEGCEAQRQMILNGSAKYGNNNDEADKYVKYITEWISAECEKYTPVHRNAKLIPSLFCWVMHDILGQNTGASPDGRKAGFPLGDGSGPAQGREHNGPTASILSSTKWEHTKFIGGIAVNMKFSKKNFNEQSRSKLITLVKTFLKRGGFEFQINVTDPEILRKAEEAPEQYRDLVVRIGGYSDYYVSLSPTMRAEVLQRTEHEI